MDPALHTVDYMRKHSALLLTSIMAVSTQTRQHEGDRALALSLYSHAERLYLVVLATNAKSAELVWVGCCERLYLAVLKITGSPGIIFVAEVSQAECRRSVSHV